MSEEILVKLANVNTVEELNAVLAENGAKLEEGVTPEAFLEALRSGGDELTEDALDDVAGGLVTPVAILAAALGISVALYIKRYRHGGGGGHRF